MTRTVYLYWRRNPLIPSMNGSPSMFTASTPSVPAALSPYLDPLDDRHLLATGFAENRSAPILPLEIEPIIQSSDQINLAWMENLKVIIFWVFLVGVISFSIWFYLHEHPELIGWVKQLTIVKAIKTLWSWLVNNLRRARSGIGKTVNSVV